MKTLLPIFVFFGIQIASAQDDTSKTITFSGYVFDMDSVPQEDVILVNFRDLKIVSTDSTGHFTMWVKENDSLMISHISFKRKPIHVNSKAAKFNNYYLEYQTYDLRDVRVQTYDRDLANFNNNMSDMFAKMRLQGIPVDYNCNRTSPHANRFDPKSANYIAGPGINLYTILEAILKKKKKPAN